MDEDVEKMLVSAGHANKISARFVEQVWKSSDVNGRSAPYYNLVRLSFGS